MMYLRQLIAKFRRGARRYGADVSGNAALLFGISLIPLLLAVGVAVDFTMGTAVKQKLAGTADSIALAAARSHRDLKTRDKVGQRFLRGNMASYGLGTKIKNLSVEFDDEAEIVTVSLQAEVPTYFMSLAGFNSQTIGAKSKVSYERQITSPVSLSMVLDVSGSMRIKGKIDALRVASRKLLRRLRRADPGRDYVRTGLVAYSNLIVERIDMGWGTDHTRPVVEGLVARGGTASAQAVSIAGQWLVGRREYERHRRQSARNGGDLNLKRFLIFMTDGENTNRAEDHPTRQHCDSFKNAGIEIFAIAFEAPFRGRRLLRYCASSSAHYFDANDSSEFLRAFNKIGEHIETSLIRIVE